MFLLPAITLFSLAAGAARRRATMLALSSLSKSSRFVGIMYAAVIFFTDGDLSACCDAVTGSTCVSLDLVRRQTSRSSATRSSACRRATTRRGRSSLSSIVGSDRGVGLDPRAARARRRGRRVSAGSIVARRSPVEVVRPGHRPERRHASRCRPASPACSARTAPASRRS